MMSLTPPTLTGFSVYFRGLKKRDVELEEV
jgi:hypothetical protein